MRYNKTIRINTVEKPYNLEYTVWVLRRRPKNIVDQYVDEHYRRLLKIKDQLVLVSLYQPNIFNQELIVKVASNQEISKDILNKVQSIVTRTLGLDINLSLFYEKTYDHNVSVLLNRFRGMRPTRYPSLLEAFVNVISCQQISIEAGLSIINRIVKNYGESASHEGCMYYSFPKARDLLDVDDENLRSIGLSYNKARYIKNVAYLIESRQLESEYLSRLPDDELFDRLCSVKGIGRWSAEYLMLRYFGRLNIFPGDDIGAQNNIRSLQNLDHKPNYDEIRGIIDSWSPYAGLIYFHLLLDKIYNKQYSLDSS
ncbi:DNA-3-methyladenine glycosylase 2 family protein [Candidatus Saccharibacteria bacterium]|nr:DNA-3-methyladenine glycosylase 2 family protein [Candidatus Saccharibacteria bacterium]